MYLGGHYDLKILNLASKCAKFASQQRFKILLNSCLFLYFFILSFKQHHCLVVVVFSYLNMYIIPSIHTILFFQQLWNIIVYSLLINKSPKISYKKVFFSLQKWKGGIRRGSLKAKGCQSRMCVFFKWPPSSNHEMKEEMNKFWLFIGGYSKKFCDFRNWI